MLKLLLGRHPRNWLAGADSCDERGARKRFDDHIGNYSSSPSRKPSDSLPQQSVCCCGLPSSWPCATSASASTATSSYLTFAMSAAHNLFNKMLTPCLARYIVHGAPAKCHPDKHNFLALVFICGKLFWRMKAEPQQQHMLDLYFWRMKASCWLWRNRTHSQGFSILHIYTKMNHRWFR